MEKIKKTVSFFLVFILLTLIAFQTCGEQLLSSEEAIEDARYLRDRLETIHPNLYFATKKEAVENRFDDILDRLRAEENWSKKALYRELAPFVAGFQDGHTFLSVHEEFAKYAAAGGKLFPLLVRIRDGRISVTANLRGTKPGAGSLITAINGVAAGEVVRKMENLVGAARKPYLEKKISDNFPVFLWALFECDGLYSIEYESADGDRFRVNTVGVSLDRYRKRRDQLHDSREVNWQLSFPREDLALLRLNTFRGDLKSEFKQFVRSSFREIHNLGVNYLIIDLRHNGGGSTRLSDFLYRYVSGKPFRTFAEVRVRYSKPVRKEQNILNPVTLFRVKVLGEELITYRNDYHAPPKPKYRFDGELFVLTGPGTFSTAADFAATIKDVDAGKIVGAETGGLASSYGDVFSGELPNSGLDFGVSYKHFIRTGGFDDGRGVIPDIRCDFGEAEAFRKYFFVYPDMAD